MSSPIPTAHPAPPRRRSALVALVLSVLLSISTLGLAAPAQAAPNCGVLGAAASAQATTAVQRACSQLGVPYVWGGGHGPTPGVTSGGFDCSGLVRFAYAGAAGYDILGTGNTTSQWNRTAGSTRVSSWSALRPGDLVYYSDNGTTSGIYHVALYLGDNWLIEAPKPGLNVRMINRTGSSDFLGGVRLYPTSTSVPAAPVAERDHVSDWSGDGYADVLGVDAAGALWYYPHNGDALSARQQLGNGWADFKHVMAADWSGDAYADVLGVDAAGALWYYPHNGDALGARQQLGNGWADFKHVMAADWSGDGKADVLGVDANGDLWYYAHNGNALSNPVKIGSGWASFKQVIASDWSGDGKADVLGVDANGDLWYYAHNGNGLSPRQQLGNGWASFKHVM